MPLPTRLAATLIVPPRQPQDRRVIPFHRRSGSDGRLRDESRSNIELEKFCSIGLSVNSD